MKKLEEMVSPAALELLKEELPEQFTTSRKYEWRQSRSRHLRTLVDDCSQNLSHSV